MSPGSPATEQRRVEESQRTEPAQPQPHTLRFLSLWLRIVPSFNNLVIDKTRSTGASGQWWVQDAESQRKSKPEEVYNQ